MAETQIKERFAAREEQFLARAAEATGLDDFGDPSFRTGYRHFLESLDAAGKLSDQGASATEQQIDLLLRCRLKTIAAWKARPDFAAQKIEPGNESTKENLGRLQNGKDLSMKRFGMIWYGLQLEKPPKSMGVAPGAAPFRKGFRQKPQRRH